LIVDSSSSSESEDTDEEENGHITDSQQTPSKDSSSTNITFEALFPSMRQVYGMEIEHPKKPDILMYKRYGILHCYTVISQKQNIESNGNLLCSENLIHPENQN
jgi:hypothetical protein